MYKAILHIYPLTNYKTSFPRVFLLINLIQLQLDKKILSINKYLKLSIKYLSTKTQAKKYCFFTTLR